jgi:hypothetical protein
MTPSPTARSDRKNVFFPCFEKKKKKKKKKKKMVLQRPPLVELPGGPDKLTIEKPPSQDNSQSGSYDPSPRDILMTDPDLVSGSSSSPRRKPGILNRFFPTSSRRKGSSKEGSGSPSPAVSPRQTESETLDAAANNNNSISNNGGSNSPRAHPGSSSSGSSSPQDKRRSSGSVLSTSSPNPLSAAISQLRSSGKGDRTSGDRQRKKDEKRELKNAKKLEKLHRREADELIESIMAKSMTVSIEELFNDLPKVARKEKEKKIFLLTKKKKSCG